MNTKLNAKIFREIYNQFLLPVSGHLVPIPYRINIPPAAHPARQGKSSPEVILKQLKEDASQQNFDLKKASVDEIRKFMEKNLLGLDCSGFAYRILDAVLTKYKQGRLQDLGFPHVGRTNVNLLTSDEFTASVIFSQEIQPGDLIKMQSRNSIPHVLIVIEKGEDLIIYAHSSQNTEVSGVHTGKIKIVNPNKSLEQQEWKEEFSNNSNYGLLYDPQAGDKVVRLKKFAS